MISRNRSISSAAARSIECTTSANSTVTCLYSACVSDSTTGEPQPWQNRAFARGSVPHVRQAAVAVIATLPQLMNRRPVTTTRAVWRSGVPTAAHLTIVAPLGSAVCHIARRSAPRPEHGWVPHMNGPVAAESWASTDLE